MRHNQIDKQSTQVTVSPDSNKKADTCTFVENENESRKRPFVSPVDEQNNKKVKPDSQHYENKEEKGIVESDDVCSRTCMVKSNESQSSNIILQNDDLIAKQQPLTPTSTKTVTSTEHHVSHTLSRQKEPKTPLSSRSKSHNNQLKVSKLVFDEKKQLETIELDERKCDISEGKIVDRTENTSGIQAKLLRELSEKEEVLRKLRMVKMYRSKVKLFL